MKISEMIAILNRIKHNVGDVQIVVFDGSENNDLQPKGIRAESDEAPADVNPDDTFGNGLVMIAVIDPTV